MRVHGKFMKLLQKRMRRACGIKDDSLKVTYYMNSETDIVVMVHAKNGELAAIQNFSSLEDFIWALVTDKKEVTA